MIRLLPLLLLTILTIACKPTKQRCYDLYGQTKDSVRIDTVLKYIMEPKEGQYQINTDTLAMLSEGQIITKVIHDTVTQKILGKTIYRKGKGGTVHTVVQIDRDTVFVPFKTVAPCPPTVCPPTVNKWLWFAYGAGTMFAIFVLTLKLLK